MIFGNIKEKEKTRKRKKEKEIPYYNQRPIDLKGLDLTYEGHKLKASTFQRPQSQGERSFEWMVVVCEERETT